MIANNNFLKHNPTTIILWVAIIFVLFLILVTLYFGYRMVTTQTVISNEREELEKSVQYGEQEDYADTSITDISEETSTANLDVENNTVVSDNPDPVSSDNGTESTDVANVEEEWMMVSNQEGQLESDQEVIINDPEEI